MSRNPEQKGSEEKKSGVNVGNLPRLEEKLRDEEARQTKGGGGITGVLKNGFKSSGEEIPQ